MCRVPHLGRHGIHGREEPGAQEQNDDKSSEEMRSEPEVTMKMCLGMYRKPRENIGL